MKKFLEKCNTKGEGNKEHRLSKMEEEQKQQSTKNDIGENNNIGKDNEAYHAAKPSSDGNVVLTGVTKFNGIYNVSYQSKTNF